MECEKYGTRTSCIVCCHLLRTTDLVLGFVEDGDPDDPLAGCNDCEQLYEREQDWTDTFKAFADLKSCATLATRSSKSCTDAADY